MLPTFQLFGRTIGMYGLMIVIGLIFGISLALLRSRKYSMPMIDVLFASFFGSIGLFVGAKLLYIITIIPKLITYYKIFLDNPSLLNSMLIGGFVFYGGLIGALVGFYIYCRLYKISLLPMLDLIAPSIPLIHGLGRIGCLFAGCCYGFPYNGPGHITFHLSQIAPHDIALFPTQALESVLNFIICVLLLLYARRAHKQGHVLGIYIILYSIMRFVMEFFRGDMVRGYLLHLSTSQWISLLLLPLGIWMMVGKRSQVHNLSTK